MWSLPWVNILTSEFQHLKTWWHCASYEYMGLCFSIGWIHQLQINPNSEAQSSFLQELNIGLSIIREYRSLSSSEVQCDHIIKILLDKKLNFKNYPVICWLFRKITYYNLVRSQVSQCPIQVPKDMITWHDKPAPRLCPHNTRSYPVCASKFSSRTLVSLNIDSAPTLNRTWSQYPW